MFCRLSPNFTCQGHLQPRLQDHQTASKTIALSTKIIPIILLVGPASQKPRHPAIWWFPSSFSEVANPHGVTPKWLMAPISNLIIWWWWPPSASPSSNALWNRTFRARNYKNQACVGYSTYFYPKLGPKSHFYIFRGKLEESTWVWVNVMLFWWMKRHERWAWIKHIPWFDVVKGLWAKSMVALPLRVDRLMCTQTMWGALSPTWERETHISTPSSFHLFFITY